MALLQPAEKEGTPHVLPSLSFLEADEDKQQQQDCYPDKGADAQLGIGR
ncbi:MAG: hypothetical protein WBX22_13020 [Silvibacterium sp.]